ncbi:MAG: sulfur transferase domain-containing protein [Acidobacteriota bacterium]|nr:sulfur transferase domain-containing protein [Acidobacteriota bacterium]MDH3523084.1 sulfur transferase domain-containing protein [Acidobacteriota bacterium]
MSAPPKHSTPVLALTAAVALLCSPACTRSAPAPEAEPAPQPEPAAVASIDPATLLPNGAEPFPGILTGGQPTREQLDEASSLGIRTVINLRTPGESDIGQADVEARGMTYVAIPIAGDGLTAANAAAFAAALDAAERPAIVHCGSGNRVGALFALAAYYQDGADPEAAIELGKKAGLTRLEPAVREHLAAAVRD